MDNNPDTQQQPQESFSKKPPLAFFIWIIIFVFIAILLIVKFGPARKYKNWDQSMFEKKLRAGDIISAEVTPETGSSIWFIEGKYRKDPGELEPQEKTSNSTLLDDLRVGYYSVKALPSENLDNLFRAQPNVKLTVKNYDTWWRGLIMTLLPILLIVGILYFLFSRQIKMAGRGAMQFGKSKARMILPDENKITFDDVAGADEAKEETKEIIDYLKDPLKFKMLGGKIPKGALLMGPPGTGKTLLAKAVTGEANVPFFSISGSDFVEMFVGVGASRVRDMFEQARRHCPCLLFIDEIDAVGRSRFSGIGGGHDEREQTLNALLVEMDGLVTNEGVIILAATNRPDVLDPALLRPGRFDRQIALDLPDIKGRRKILDVHIKNIKAADDINLDIIAKGTPGFSGADLANLINEAALLAARNDRDAAIMEDMEEARDKVRWGRERRSRRVSARERKITAYHEAGHALAALMFPHALPVHKVTIIPRGQALGATMHLPDEDRYTQSKSEMIDMIRVLMGGRVAEELILDEITSGAANDIKQATQTARMMVCSFGMNEKLGSVQYGQRSEHIYLGRDITKDEPYSEETAREIDLEIKKIVEGCKNDTYTLLTENRDKLEKLTKELLEKETLDVKEIRKLLDLPEPQKEKEIEDVSEEDKSDEKDNGTGQEIDIKA
jgi:cell division protease FtsH